LGLRQKHWAQAG